MNAMCAVTLANHLRAVAEAFYPFEYSSVLLNN